jgi:hypothetical protein
MDDNATRVNCGGLMLVRVMVLDHSTRVITQPRNPSSSRREVMDDNATRVRRFDQKVAWPHVMVLECRNPATRELVAVLELLKAFKIMKLDGKSHNIVSRKSHGSYQILTKVHRVLY